MAKKTSLTFKGAVAQAKEEFKMSDNAAEVFVRRYVRKGEDGSPAESPTDTFKRVAKAGASADKKYGKATAASERKFFDILSDFLFVPNSPTWTGAMTPLGQLAACFVLPLKDDLGRDPEGIYSTLRNAVLIQQTGGGIGFSFSRLRPRGDFVSRSGGRSTGPIGFLEAYDKSIGVIAQGGVRRGASMAVLRVDHPEIREFIHCKEKEGAVTNFNISIAATDKFMDAVRLGGKLSLVNPRNDKVWAEVDAQSIFDEIATAAHRNGEPGILFIDAANRENPVPQLYDIEATNPCGEQWLGPYENCCLGSINLARHLTRGGKIDWEELASTTRWATYFLDNVVDANKYVPAVPALRRAALAVRRIGVGIMGLADVMYANKVRYGDEDGVELAAQLMEFIRYHTMLASVERARERGPFPKIKGSIYDAKDLQWEPPQPLTPYKLDFGRPKISWERVSAGIKKHGIRNGAQQVIAPTGTISTVSDCEGYGCEPVFALSYVRKLFQAGGEKQENRELCYTSPLFEKALEKAGVSQKKREKIYAEVRKGGSIQKIKGISDELKRVFVVSQDITPRGHILVQAALQRFVDNSISKTCNFPASATVEDVKKAYFEAWELGCKGLTVYITGSRREVVLETEETRRKREGELAIKPRPHKTVGSTYRIDTPVGSAFITINENGDGNPLELFVNVGKAGSDISADAEAIGRLSSLVLRIDPTMKPKERLAAMIDQLQGIGGSRSVGFGSMRVRSLADGIARVLADYLGWKVEESKGKKSPLPLGMGKVKKLSDICPDCGQATLVFEEGCQKCHSCGFSEC
jgi:ribonucleoside-diphosphate reductase alpha chain